MPANRGHWLAWMFYYVFKGVIGDSWIRRHHPTSSIRGLSIQWHFDGELVAKRIKAVFRPSSAKARPSDQYIRIWTKKIRHRVPIIVFRLSTFVISSYLIWRVTHQHLKKSFTQRKQSSNLNKQQSLSCIPHTHTHT